MIQHNSSTETKAMRTSQPATKRTIERWVSSAKEGDLLTLHDTNLALRKRRRGASWVLRAFRNGRRVHETFGHWPAVSLIDAQLHADTRVEEIRVDTPTKLLFEEFARTFLDTLRKDAEGPHESTLADYESYVRGLNRLIGDKPLISITSATIKQVEDAYLACPNQKHKILGLLRRILIDAGARGHLVKDPHVFVTFDDIKKKKKKYQPKTESFTDEQLRAFGQAIEEMWATNYNARRALLLVKLVALTGCRPIEAMKARIEDIDLEKGIWTRRADYLLKTHDNKDWAIPFNAHAASVLTKMLHTCAGNGLLMGGQKETRIFEEIRELAGYPKTKFYWFRHTLETRLDEVVGNKSAIEWLLTHKTPGIAGVYKKPIDYLRPFPGSREAINVYGDMIGDFFEKLE